MFLSHLSVSQCFQTKKLITRQGFTNDIFLLSHDIKANLFTSKKLVLYTEVGGEIHTYYYKRIQKTGLTG